MDSSNPTGASAQRYAPPRAAVADVQDADSTELAGRGQRLLAALIDGAIALAAMWLLGRLTPFNVWKPDLSHGIVRMLAVSFVLGFGMFALLQGWLLATRGQTIGKALLGLRIVRSDGSAVGIGRMLGLRYGVGWLLSIVPVVGGLYALADSLLIFRDSRRCLHDNIADTIVVKA